MASDFGFHNLAWFKYVEKKVYDVLYPLRSREILLDREILDLMGKIDVKQAEKKNLHLRAILESRRLGLTKEDIDLAVKTELEERRKVIDIPASKDYMPGREVREEEDTKPIRPIPPKKESPRTTKPFGSKLEKPNIDSWHPQKSYNQSFSNEGPPSSAQEMEDLASQALRDVERATPRLGLQRREVLSTQRSMPKTISKPEEPIFDPSTLPPSKKTLLGRVLSTFTGATEETVKKNKNDDR